MVWRKFWQRSEQRYRVGSFQQLDILVHWRFGKSRQRELGVIVAMDRSKCSRWCRELPSMMDDSTLLACAVQPSIFQALQSYLVSCSLCYLFISLQTLLWRSSFAELPKTLDGAHQFLYFQPIIETDFSRIVLSSSLCSFGANRASSS